MNQAEAKPTEEILLVYIGQRVGAKDKLIDLWLEVSPEQFENGELPTTEETDDKYRVYHSKESRKRMTDSPGSVYAVPQVVGTTSIFSQDARYKGRWPNEAARLVWQAKHRLVVAEADMRKKASREGREDDFAPLAPLREMYGRLISRNQKAALLGSIIAYVTGGRS